MEYVVFLAATLVLATCFPHWEPTGRFHSAAGTSRFPGLIGVLAHLGGTAAIAWSSGFAAGLAAILAIPLAASAIYTLIVNPLARSRRKKAPRQLPRVSRRLNIREYRPNENRPGATGRLTTSRASTENA